MYLQSIFFSSLYYKANIINKIFFFIFIEVINIFIPRPVSFCSRLFPRRNSSLADPASSYFPIALYRVLFPPIKSKTKIRKCSLKSAYFNKFCITSNSVCLRSRARVAVSWSSRCWSSRSFCQASSILTFRPGIFVRPLAKRRSSSNWKNKLIFIIHE